MGKPIIYSCSWVNICELNDQGLEIEVHNMFLKTRNLICNGISYYLVSRLMVHLIAVNFEEFSNVVLFYIEYRGSNKMTLLGARTTFENSEKKHSYKFTPMNKVWGAKIKIQKECYFETPLWCNDVVSEVQYTYNMLHN